MHEWIQQSDALHERVQAFIAGGRASDDSFETLALAIAAYQASTIPAFARLVRARGSDLRNLTGVPAVHVEAFRMTRVAAHPPELDQVRFLTSGTTSGARGQHCMRRTDTYRLAAVTWGRHALLPLGTNSARVLSIAPRPDPTQHSSLGFMMRAFLEDFDTQGLNDDDDRWLLSEHGVDVANLRKMVEAAAGESRPLLILATSFALVYVLDALDGQRLATNGRVIVMQTGGFKGKSREVAPDALRRGVAKTLGIPLANIVGEYGMTELSSQLYEGTLPNTALFGDAGWYIPPPWLRVEAVDPISFVPLDDGEVGLARFTDLANIDSALRILTEDRIRCREGRVQLLGRLAEAVDRGCSLSDEELVT